LAINWQHVGIKLSKVGKKLSKSWQKACKQFVKKKIAQFFSEHLLKFLKRSEEEEEEGDL
jgi:hypothetical protein